MQKAPSHNTTRGIEPICIKHKKTLLLQPQPKQRKERRGVLSLSIYVNDPSHLNSLQEDHETEFSNSK